jgi:hypothetical protein
LRPGRAPLSSASRGTASLSRYALPRNETDSADPESLARGAVLQSRLPYSPKPPARGRPGGPPGRRSPRGPDRPETYEGHRFHAIPGPGSRETAGCSGRPGAPGSPPGAAFFEKGPGNSKKESFLIKPAPGKGFTGFPVRRWRPRGPAGGFRRAQARLTTGTGPVYKKPEALEARSRSRSGRPRRPWPRLRFRPARRPSGHARFWPTLTALSGSVLRFVCLMCSCPARPGPPGRPLPAPSGPEQARQPGTARPYPARARSRPALPDPARPLPVRQGPSGPARPCPLTSDMTCPARFSL